ncbi:hypothetical protein Dimus_010622 [Dionaea muscipula]
MAACELQDMGGDARTKVESGQAVIGLLEPPYHVISSSSSLLPLEKLVVQMSCDSAVGMIEKGEGDVSSMQGILFSRGPVSDSTGLIAEVTDVPGGGLLSQLVSDGGQAVDLQQGSQLIEGDVMGNLQEDGVAGDLAPPLAEGALAGAIPVVGTEVSGARGGSGHSYAADVGSDRRSDVRIHFMPSVRLDDGDELCMTDSDWAGMEWEPCLVGHFLQSGVLFIVVRPWLMHLWRAKGLVEVQSLDVGFFIFRFSSLEGRDKILDGGPWFVGGKPLYLRRWEQMMSLTREMMSRVPVWANFYNVPQYFWDPAGLNRIASAVGHPLYMDQFKASRSRLSFAWVCAEKDAARPCRRELESAMGVGPVLSRSSLIGFLPVVSGVWFLDIRPLGVRSVTLLHRQLQGQRQWLLRRRLVSLARVRGVGGQSVRERDKWVTGWWGLLEEVAWEVLLSSRVQGQFRVLGLL